MTDTRIRQLKKAACATEIGRQVANGGSSARQMTIILRRGEDIFWIKRRLRQRICNQMGLAKWAGSNEVKAGRLAGNSVSGGRDAQPREETQQWPFSDEPRHAGQAG